jgi:peptidoglycan/xylan/chitin deacetylase (PgdA/CDA1 family)
MAGYRRPGSYGRRRNSYLKLAAAAAGALLVIAIIVAVIIALAGRPKDDNVAKAAPGSTIAPSEAPAEPTAAPTQAPTEAPTIAPTQAPTEEPARAGGYVSVLPTPTQEGYLPVFRKGETDEKVMCITVDDFWQFENARKIIELAVRNDAKLTLFPIGLNVLRDELKDTLIYAYENGMELENHTYEHEGLYRMNDKKMARQIYLQNLALNSVLGVEYQQHFFRPKGGDGRDDQRTHEYIKQLGMYGIAYWTVSDSVEIDELLANMAPGNIYLFHTTDTDLAELEVFIPAAIEAGYRFVTLNEMFGFPENEVKELAGPIKDYEIPQLQEYELTPRVYKEGDYMWQVNLIQQRLVELGYLDVDPDGIFGDSTERAIKAFQNANGLKANGNANLKTQAALFSEDAKKK